MLKDLIKNAQSPWTIGAGDDKDVVLCTRIRLARNFAKYPFPLKQTEQSGQSVLADMSAFCKDHSNLKFYDLRDVPLELLDIFGDAGSCLGELEEHMILEDIVYGSTMQ